MARDAREFARLPMACAAIALAVAAFGVEREARAFCRTTTLVAPADYNPSKGCWSQGAPLFWPSTCIGYSVARAASKQVDYNGAARVVAAAFAAWTAPHCVDAAGRFEPPSISAVLLGPSDSTDIGYNVNGPNTNLVVFRDAAWPHDVTDEMLALVTLTFDAESSGHAGRVLDADLEVNTAQHTFTVNGAVPADGFNLQTILTHEAGHFLGFGHSSDANATMFASYTPGSTTQSKPAQDDINAVCTVYPPGGQRPTANGPLPAEACALASSSAAACAPSVQRACAVGAVGVRGVEKAGPWSCFTLLAALVGVLVTRRTVTASRSPAFHRPRKNPGIV